MTSKIKPTDWCFKWPNPDDDGQEQPRKTPWVTDDVLKSHLQTHDDSQRDVANAHDDWDDDEPRDDFGC